MSESSHPAGVVGVVGVLGGGQLGRMFVHAAQSQGLQVWVLDPDRHSPAAAAADHHLAAAYDDAEALIQMQAQCSAITTEFENVPAAVLAQLAAAGKVVSPPAAAVRVCQHRALEKKCFLQAGVPCAPHALLAQASDLDNPGLRTLLPGILKTASLGYDGKGQVAVDQLSDLPEAWAALNRQPCVLEARLPLAHEISVIVARGRDGAAVNLPVQQNLHRRGVLAVTQVPAPDVPAAVAEQAIAYAHMLAKVLNYAGVLCVEFFVLQDGTLVANEMAPRPHNSGHYSLDACDQSQFDLQLRTLLGWPLTPPRLHSPAVMLNLMGDLWFGKADVAPDTEPRTPDWPTVLALPGVHLHLYGKTQARAGRKMGHLTITAASAQQARATALQAAAALGLAAF